ncbi:hypothetical protein CO057_01320 [Candidatus Uhrbacteria bacterium CG_4_9_14_0_2_um_filter_41_50]|uniref:Uncharacterized protein n=1 Tax=Candidatus Uhrbacteria bacterium CG_4_9_14_0_2_um_filter_41_50 TaxID=1975031 RepID=A0A2M8EPS7_9BACT|nr:MAG: hypothetical protein COZ45_03980 [Candidatus Uhrbacteria bacterium CG_4_10_14_3_um_filter_41_21]PIZ55307.1 MAG: hypothetical protein COY24_00920 [Candidatus Uhrbacteria bacterium CG_4_10_14_0_2_um_filter_41_21]PJB84546.1 MAG: hypothetical protein CO086_03090 [Candidatus Uhrbacteria bacterium CG_4_9_14_0_8_um_filter_41_16]PJC24736.1 MAG: hypothetical protein CO057_01320 [Candidatus Uhrbacteria bacterium CG_4_9_14_0_2_um_filter_41_50]PJE74911.1 MAG: hypothetical protein COV03_02980 [Candi
MILLHRITPAAISALTVLGFSLLIFAPDYLVLALICLFVGIPLLFARLLVWEFKRGAFWVFWGLPVFFLISSVFFFLFLEHDAAKILLALVDIIGLWFYSENLFAFYHLPGSYQAYSLEYLSLVIAISSGFLFSTATYAAQLFLQLPVWIPAIVILLSSSFLSIAVFWVSKIAFATGARFALVGAIILTELYVALAMLPTSFMSNAAGLATFFYLFLGLSRAHILDKLTVQVLKRYLLVGGALLIIIFATTRWI